MRCSETRKTGNAGIHDMLAQLCTRRTCDSKGPVLLQASAGGGRLVSSCRSSNAGHVRPPATQRCDACSHSIAPRALTALQRPFEASVQLAAKQCVPVDIEALPTHARCERKIAPAHRVGHVGRAGDSLPFGMHLRLLDEDPGRLKQPVDLVFPVPFDESMFGRLTVHEEKAVPMKARLKSHQWHHLCEDFQHEDEEPPTAEVTHKPVRHTAIRKEGNVPNGHYKPQAVDEGGWTRFAPVRSTLSFRQLVGEASQIEESIGVDHRTIVHVEVQYARLGKR